ncbi:YwqG family protein [Corynebacterium kalidii]|uniref:YwqG family protein n=1 Tax=Corynebacterium kalidii TaxID=2931982 RepID=A0A9X1WGM6_9CORY|nr:YwqG family protein [Corynebacterium kalidii]MCJ7858126.1 YwqG family protein [Corynebacterium kalidii]
MFESLHEARAAIEKHVAPEHVDNVLDVLIPAIGLKPGDPDETVRTGSRLGGVPDLPVGMEWPRPEPPTDPRDIAGRGHSSDEKMMLDHLSRNLPFAFVAQIDLAEAHALGEVAADLPDTGRLLFFYDFCVGPWENGARVAAVVWDTSPAEQTVAATMPDDLADAAAHGTGSFDAEVFHAPARPVTLFGGVTIPVETSNAPETEYVFEPGGLADVTDGVEDFWDEDECWDGWRHHQLLGTPVPLQSDPRDYIAGDGTDEEVSDWRLLFQLDIYNWDGGKYGDGDVYFLIRTADLAARHFDRVQAVYQQT